MKTITPLTVLVLILRQQLADGSGTPHHVSVLAYDMQHAQLRGSSAGNFWSRFNNAIQVKDGNLGHAKSVKTPSVHATALHAESVPESTTPSVSTESEACKMPLWMEEPLKVPQCFTDAPVAELIPNFDDNFELIDRNDKHYCKAFRSIDGTCKTGDKQDTSCVGTTLFGDAYPLPGGGGISTFNVIKVKEGAEVALYGGRYNLDDLHQKDATLDDHSDFWNQWWADSWAFTDPFVSFTEYSNERMALAFRKTEFAKCTLKPGALVVVGSGAYRNTSMQATHYDREHGTTWGNPLVPADTYIDEMQIPDARFLQYIFKVQDAAQDCFYWPLDSENMWKSMRGEGTQFLKNGEYVTAD